MNNRTTELVFLIDKSGSMRGLERATIRGINMMLNQQRTSSGRVLVSTVLFSDNTELLHDREDLEAVRPLTRYDYYTNGCTALMDAIGETIGRIRTIQQYGNKEAVPGKTLFVIMTDGYENASRHFTTEQIRGLIKDSQHEDGWEFLFFGANIDVARVASNLGITRDRTAVFRVDSEGIREHFNTLSGIIDSYIADDEPPTEIADDTIPLNRQRVGKFVEKIKGILGFEPDEYYDWEE